jgi:prevent-host-death family protein
MAEVPARELRNDTAGVLRRVDQGENVTITVHGRPVARLSPVDSRRRRPIPWHEFIARMERDQADPGLRDELRELAGEMTDDTEKDW